MGHDLDGYHAFYIFHALHELFLDEVLERHLGEGTAGAVSLQLDLYYTVIDIHELDVSTIHAKAFPDLIQGDLDVILEILHEYFSLL